MNLYEKTASELSQMLLKKECSSKEIVASLSERIAEVEADLNAFIALDLEAAQKQAEQIDDLRQKGQSMHPLAGIPVALKDNIHVKGMHTTCASKMMEQFVAPFDATVTEKIKDANMIILGKTNMDEFALGNSGETSLFGATKNPWNTAHVPGGSSSGSAAAVSAGEIPLALGSDTGGSVRVPAAYCGICGLKPTYGNISRYGAVAAASSFDQIGPMARSIKDIALFYDLLKGNDPRDAVTVTKQLPSTVEKLTGDIKGLRIGIPKEYFANSYSPEVLESVEKAAKTLESMGAVLVDATVPSAEQANEIYYILMTAEISSNLGRFDGVRTHYRAENYTNWDDMFVKTRSSGFGAGVQKRILFGTYVLTEEQYQTYFARAKSWQRRLTNDLLSALNHCDLLLTPTSSTTAFSFDDSQDVTGAYGMDYSTAFANLSGLPGVSLPCGIGKNNLPIGIQFVGKPCGESTILNAAFAYEVLLGGFPFCGYKGESK